MIKSTKKVLSMLLALVMMVGVFAPTVVGAAEEGKSRKTKVTITKLQADSYSDEIKNNKGIPHNGSEKSLSDLGTALGTTVTGLDGVEFTYFKVTETQYNLLKKANASNLKEVQKIEGLSNVSGKKLEPTKDGGKVSEDLADGYYWFIETGKPKNVSSAIAIPFGLSLPMTSSDGTKIMDEVFVYPKNITGDEPEVDKDVEEIGNDNSSANVGDIVPWIINVTIPANIKDYKKLDIKDKIDARLNYGGHIKVAYGNIDNLAGIKEIEDPNVELSEKNDYTLVQPNEGNKGGELEISFTETGIAKLAKLRKVKEGKVYVYFETKINEDAVMGQEIPNKPTIDFDNGNTQVENKEVPKEKIPKTVTSGKKFIKKEVGTETNLAGAAFYIINNFDKDGNGTKEDYILTGTYPNWRWVKYDKDNILEEAHKLTSSAPNGTFEIKGLEYSKWNKMKWDPTANNGDGGIVVDKEILNDYRLVEIKAPEGYGLIEDKPDDDGKYVLGFEVDKNSYYKDPDSTALEDADPDRVDNKKLTIPQTGGIGTAIFVVLGGALMVGAFVAMKRNSKEQA